MCGGGEYVYCVVMVLSTVIVRVEGYSILRHMSNCFSTSNTARQLFYVLLTIIVYELLSFTERIMHCCIHYGVSVGLSELIRMKCDLPTIHVSGK